MPFSENTLSFLMENRLMDSREWFHAHKAEYEEFIVAPMAELCTRLAPAMLEIDPEFIVIPQVGKSISRLWRDTRYSKDGSIFREYVWLSFVIEKYRGYPQYWAAVSPGGVEWGCGWYDAGSATMKRLRERVIADDPAWLAADKALRAQSALTEHGRTYKKSPYTAYPEDKRRWLEQMNVSLETGLRPERTFDPDLAEEIERDFRAVAPVYKFLRDVTVRWEW